MVYSTNNFSQWVSKTVSLNELVVSISFSAQQDRVICSLLVSLVGFPFFRMIVLRRHTSTCISNNNSTRHTMLVFWPAFSNTRHTIMLVSPTLISVDALQNPPRILLNTTQTTITYRRLIACNINGFLVVDLNSCIDTLVLLWRMGTYYVSLHVPNKEKLRRSNLTEDRSHTSMVIIMYDCTDSHIILYFDNGFCNVLAYNHLMCDRVWKLSWKE